MQIPLIPAGADAGLARAERQQQFFSNRFVNFLELQLRLALVAQELEDGRTIFFLHLDPRIFEPDDVNLERLDLKIPRIATIWTAECHSLDFRRW
jgi:hypothetical protein